MEYLKNRFFMFIVALFFLTLINACQDNKTKREIEIKNKFYKIFSKDHQLLSYNYREYRFNKDTITEKCITIDLKGKIKSIYKKRFLKEGLNFYILFNKNSKVNKNLYFSITNKDTCYNVIQQFGKVKVCFNGLISNERYKDAFKIYYEDMAYDGNSEDLILDKDFTLISRFCKNNTQKKEYLVDDSEVDFIVKRTAKKIQN